jgi:hypothetical protein
MKPLERQIKFQKRSHKKITASSWTIFTLSMKQNVIGSNRGIEEVNAQIEVTGTFGHFWFEKSHSPLQFMKERISSLETENKELKDKLVHTQEALAIVDTEHEWCLSHKDMFGWTTDQVERMREISNLMSSAVRVRDSCTRLIESERTGLRSQVDEFHHQLKNERNARLEAERKLSDTVKSQRPPGAKKIQQEPKIPDGKQEKGDKSQTSSEKNGTKRSPATPHQEPSLRL